MAETKKEYHFWVLPEYEQEEEYLRKMHNQGWKLAQVSLPGIYTFERCAPEDVVYKLDFRPLQGEDKEAFLSMYRDYGWEYLQDLNDYSYFRKPAADAAPGDLDVFSDDESRLDMVKRILRWRMVPILIIVLLCMLPSLLRIFGQPYYDGWDIALLVGVSLLVLAWLYVMVRCLVGFRRLWKKYSHNAE